MKAFLIFSIIAATLLGLSNAKQCSSWCTLEYKPKCGVSANCYVSAANPCVLRYKICQYKFSPIIDVLPGSCPDDRPICKII